MMVNADRLLSLFKQSARKSKPPYIPTVQGKKDIIYHVFPASHGKSHPPLSACGRNSGSPLNTHPLQLLEIQPDILVERQTGAGTVPVRTYMTRNAGPFCSF